MLNKCPIYTFSFTICQYATIRREALLGRYLPGNILQKHFRIVCLTQYVKKDKIPGDEGAKSWVQKVILEMRVQELETDEAF